MHLLHPKQCHADIQPQNSMAASRNISTTDSLHKTSRRLLSSIQSALRPVTTTARRPTLLGELAIMYMRHVPWPLCSGAERLPVESCSLSAFCGYESKFYDNNNFSNYNNEGLDLAQTPVLKFRVQGLISVLVQTPVLRVRCNEWFWFKH